MRRKKMAEHGEGGGEGGRRARGWGGRRIGGEGGRRRRWGGRDVISLACDGFKVHEEEEEEEEEEERLQTGADAADDSQKT